MEIRTSQSSSMDTKRRRFRRQIIGMIFLLCCIAACLYFAKEIAGRRFLNWFRVDAEVLPILVLGFMVMACVVGGFMFSGMRLIRRSRHALEKSAALVNDGRPDEAVELLRSTCRGRAMDAMLYLQISYIESDRLRHDASLAAIDAAERAAGPTDWIEAGRSRTLWNACRQADALEVCRLAVRRWPESLHSRLCLTQILIESEHLDEARFDCRSEASARPNAVRETGPSTRMGTTDRRDRSEAE